MINNNNKKDYLLSAQGVHFVYPDLNKRMQVLRNNQDGVNYQLRNITINLKVGDSLGVVGQNGSGKTTLLRLLAGIYKPNIGEVVSDGSISTLFDNGYGLDLESAASKNIVLRGRLLGKSKNEITEAIKGVELFAKLGKYWDRPLRTYSSGMISRLLIGMATSFTSEILLLDEGIGTSDSRFQEAASERFRNMISSSGALVLASHNQELMNQFCKEAILMSEGEIISMGDVSEIWKLHKSMQ